MNEAHLLILAPDCSGVAAIQINIRIVRIVATTCNLRFLRKAKYGAVR